MNNPFLMKKRVITYLRRVWIILNYLSYAVTFPLTFATTSSAILFGVGL